MSLILEALRKSEERRRLGETPTLISQSEWAVRRHQPAASRSRTWLMWTLPPLAVVALAAGWWFGLREPEQSGPVAGTAQESPDSGTAATDAPVPAPATAPAAPPTATASAPQPQADAAAAPVALSAPPPSPAMPPPAMPAAPPPDAPAQAADAVPPDVRERFERGEVFANSPDQLRPPVPTTDAPIVTPEAALPEPLDDPKEVATAAMPQPASSPPPVPPASASAPAAPATGPPAAAPISPPPAVASASPPPAAGSASPPPANTSDVPYAFELSLATRQALPPLKMSMHVYAADPAHRFVLIDGERLVEGGTGGELRVVEIRANGVVLEFRGQRFLLPRNGG